MPIASNFHPTAIRSVFQVAILFFCGGMHFSSAADTNSRVGTVSVRVISECSLSILAPLDFGTLSMSSPTQNNSATTANGKLMAECSNGYPYKIYANDGLNASTTQRMRLGSSNSYLSYYVFHDSQNRFPTTLATALSAVGTSAQQFIPVYGAILSQTVTAPGTYTDTLTFTVSF